MNLSLFDPVRPEDIRKAIDEINRDGVRSGRQSSTYDLLVGGKRYPPKYVLSLAYKYATGNELDHSLFDGGENTPAFTFLRNCGYQIVPKAIENENVNYWVFQGNPAQFRIVDSLRDRALKTWRVTAHAERIKPGDKVILWVTGPEAGCYALAEVTSEVYTGIDETGEQYYQLPGFAGESTRRVKLKILLNLWDQPVIKEDIQGLTAFADFKGGSQGTNFTATREQYESISQMTRPAIPIGNRRFWKYAPGKQAARWADDLRESVMAIDFSNYDTGSLSQYATQADLDNYLGKADKNSNQTWNMILFKDATEGDVVFANRGRNTVAGIGIIRGPYRYRSDTPYNRHSRSVEWLADQEWQYPQNLFPENRNLFRIDTFSPTRMGPQIIQEYIKQYPQYKPVFEQNGLIDPVKPESLFMPVSLNNHPKNIILYGPPGTGKTYETIDLAVDIVDGRKDHDHKANKLRFDQLRKEGQIEFVTFHQNYTYEDFVMGLKPDVSAGSLQFEQREGIFYRLAKRARQNFEASRSNSSTSALRPFDELFEEFMQPLTDFDKPIQVKMASGILFQITGLGERSILFEKSNGSRKHTLSISTLKRIYEGGQEVQPNGLKPYYLPLSEELSKRGHQSASRTTAKNYVLVIDEINRANMSRVFGELITLLEEDKRLGEENELTVTLPSGEPFSVPPNLYLIGTMNTADKSLALLDIALRRRFEFIGKYPNYEVVDAPASGVLERLNRAILAHHKPADFLIGHAYFIGKPLNQLPAVFNNRVIPLLMEYFNGRTDLVMTVLNEAGIQSERQPLTDQLTVSHVE
ncbi:AAA family ATPase [Spirosoma litoris]